MIKIAKFGTKMPYLGIFELGFSKMILIFEMNSLSFFNLQNFLKKQSLNLGPKMPYLGIFGHEF